MGEMLKRVRPLLRILRDAHEAQMYGDGLEEEAADVLEGLAKQCDEQEQEIARLHVLLARRNVH